MKQRTLLFGLILSLGLLTSCDHDSIRASGEVTSLDYSIPDYSRLKVSNAFNAYVTFSDTEESIRIEANENLHNKIIVKRDGNALVIQLKKLTNIRGNATLNAYITTKNISHFEMTGASRLTLENEWVSEDARIEVSGASDFTGELSVERLHMNMHGASNVDIFGTASGMYADLSGSSEIRNYDLLVERLEIDLSGASEAFLSVSETIDIDASGASTLNYKGNADIIHKRLSGASEIRKRD
ncbi:MAG: head GIN domain-containing protein [Aurantibacter sp.]